MNLICSNKNFNHYFECFHYSNIVGDQFCPIQNRLYYTAEMYTKKINHF